ncbi:MAG: hypothetical protein AAFW46_12825 [Pseudomonadota bacterium]
MSSIAPALVAAAVTLAMFALRDVLLPLFAAQRNRREFIAALLAEVEYNIDEIADFRALSAALPVVEAFIRAKNLPPHITDTRHTRVYRESVERLFTLNPETIRRLIVFYNELDTVSGQIDGLQLASFSGISVAGKYKTVERIIDNAKKAQNYGRCAASSLRSAQIRERKKSVRRKIKANNLLLKRKLRKTRLAELLRPQSGRGR